MLIDRKPDFTDETSLSWRLFSAFGRHVDLKAFLYSDDTTDARPAEHWEIWFVLKGCFYLNWGPHCSAGDVTLVCPGQPCNVQLEKAQTYEEQLLDLPWMAQADIHYATERRAWLLVIS